MPTTQPATPTATLIDMRKVQEMTGLSRSTIDRYEKNKAFPAKVQLTDTGTRQSPVAFVLEEVETWINSRINSRAAANSSGNE